ncbi:putative inactive tRNA-specific adenosine deaminase-like protein 3 isoform X2 [Genypterus blacodes]|uniref:putative inactive tRNA-specific adenosine deaminase-like protein 3 isoform X2 n=1 Tax=Genypterus blacodes TaxID=154954 RepID=UPI003F76FA85
MENGAEHRVDSIIHLSEDARTMEPQAKRPRSSVCDADPWVAYPVLSDEQTRETQLIEAFAAPIVDKKETSRLVREVSGLYPLPGLQYIKRVRACKQKGVRHPLEILLCLCSDAPNVDTDETVSIDSLLPSGKVSTGLGEPFVVRVPAHPPLTRPQFEQASKHWPTSFHEDKQVTVALRGELFSLPQMGRMQAHMEAALTAARAGGTSGSEAVGAVMVDPKLDSVVAAGHDCRGEHPLLHAVMVCIDLVARAQGGGRYSFDKHPTCFAAPSSTSDASHSEPDAEEGRQAYICTGYDLYVTREPCLMCAMALVHSRIGRVFYGTASADGALGTRYKIHTQRDLNHRFEVYKGVLSKQCEDLNGLEGVHAGSCSLEFVTREQHSVS